MLDRHRRIAAVLMKTAACAICVIAALGHPPAHAQNGNGASAYDNVQDERQIDEKAHVKDVDDRVQRQWTAINTLQQTVSGMQGENRIIFAVLGLLQSGSLVVGLRPKKGTAS